MDGGTDFRVSLSDRPGKNAQLAWRSVVLEQGGPPYNFTVGFGAGFAGVTAVTFAAWMGCRSLVLVRGNDLDEDWFHPNRGLWVRESLSRASVIGAVSMEMIGRIEGLYPDKAARLVPNGVDVSAWELLPGDVALRDEVRAQEAFGRRAIFGLFGDLKYKKGFALWLGALRDANLIDRVGLLVVGDRIDPEARNILDDPALSPPSVRLPFSERTRLPGLYAACDFVVLPSLYDGLPNVLLEAMAIGLVPLVSDAGAMGDIVRDGETGFVFPAYDRGAAAEATVRALAADLLTRKAIGARAREFVARHFSIERETEALCEILCGDRPLCGSSTETK